MPFPTYTPEVDAFFRLVSRRGWIDSNSDLGVALDLLDDDEAIANANLAQVRAMLTACARGERYYDGHRDRMLRSGKVVRLLRRLQELRDTVP